MRYIVTILCLFSYAVHAQTVTQPGLRDYQLTGATLPDSILYIMGTDTLDGSAKQGLGKWYRGSELQSLWRDTDWLRYRTRTTPSNTDTMYHASGPVIIGSDTVDLVATNGFGKDPLNVAGVIDVRFPDAYGTNIVIGAGSLTAGGSSTNNFVMGQGIMPSATTANYNIAIGNNAMYTTSTGDFNVAIGPDALLTATGSSAQSNVSIGYRSAYSGNVTAQNVILGAQAASGGCTSFNTILGYQAGFSTPISSNVFIGYQSGRLNTGSGNIFIGKESGENETGSNLLYIDNSNGIPLIGGDFAADTLRVNGDLSIRDAVSGASTDSVMVWTPSNGRVKMRNASAFGGATNLSIAQSSGTQVIQSSTGTDVGVRNLYGLLITEGATDTLHFKVDSSKIATQYDISGFGTMSNWLLAASGTGGTETITNGETVTVSETTGLDVTRSTNTVAVALSIDEFTTDGTIEEDELLLAYDPSGTNHELIDVNSLPYIATEVDGSTTNEAWTMDADDATTAIVVSNQTVNIKGNAGIVTDIVNATVDSLYIAIDGDEFTTVTTAQSDDYLLIHDENGAGADVLEKMLWSDFVIDIIGFEEDNTSEGSGNTLDVGTGIDLSVTGSEADYSLDFNEFTTDAATEGDEYVILYDPSAVTQEKVLISSFSGADGNGIYTGDGTTPSDVDVTVTDSLEFNGTLKIINDGNDYVGIGAQTPNAKLHVRGASGNTLILEETQTTASVNMTTKSVMESISPPFVLSVQNKDAQIDISGNYYEMGNITFSKQSATLPGGAINFNVGYDSTNLDGVLQLKSRESGATDGLVNVAGGLRFKWTSSASSSYTMNTGDYGLTMTTTGAKTATIPDAVSGIVGQELMIFNAGSSGDVTITITGGSGDTIYGDPILNINESAKIICVAANKWIVNN